LLNMNSVAAQPVFTVPVGMRAVVTQVIIRDTSVALTGTANGNVAATFAFATAGAVPVVYSSAGATLTASTAGAFQFVAAGQTSAGLSANSGEVTASVQSIGSSSAATATTPVPIARQNDVLNVTLSYSVAAPAAGNFCKCDVLGYLEAL